MIDLPQRVHAASARLIAEGRIPNASVLLSRGGEIIVSDQQGRLDLARPQEIAADTIFRFFSMSKLVTTVAVLTLLDAGRLALDDAVATYVPDFATMQVRTPAGLVPAQQVMTIRHLLTHTSGLCYMAFPGPVQADYERAQLFPYLTRETETLAEHVGRLAQMPLPHEPGAKWTYGESMAVLGRIVEVVTGQRFGDYLQAQIFAPLQMVDTAFWVPPDKADRLAALYAVQEDDSLKDVSNSGFYGGNMLAPAMLEYGGAGLAGTAADLLNLAHMLLAGGIFRGQRILSETSVRAMQTNQLGPQHGPTPLAALGRGEGAGFGLGGAVTVALPAGAPPGAVGEYGWGGWAGCNFWIDPANDIAGITLTQAIPRVLAPHILGAAVRDVLYAPA